MIARHPVIVIGAGPAGLSAAHELTQTGRPALVLEKADKVGGLARTEIYKGCRFDIGGHRFYTQNNEVQRLWEKMLGDDLLKVRRLSRIHYDGNFFNYPLSLVNTLGNLGVGESSLILLSYLKAQLRPHREAETFEQWVTDRFGVRLYRRFFQSYTEKVWGMSCRTIRADWAAQRIGPLSLTTALRKALFGTNGAKTLISEFHYPVLGPGMMWQRFAQTVARYGGRVRLNSEVIRLNHRHGRIASLSVKDGPDTFEIGAEHVITSMPLAELVARMPPPPPMCAAPRRV